MTTLANREGGPTAYELLVVHPSAPADLIATSYWLLTGHLLKRRDAGKYVDDKLHELTRAYECVSDPVRRAAYDAALGHTQEPLAKRGLPHVRRSLISADVDHYEVLGITSAAPSELLPSAHRIMRNQYLRVPLENKRKLQLLDALDDAFATLGAPEKRQLYDERSRVNPVEQVVAPPPETPASARPRGTILRGLGRALSAGTRMPKRNGTNGHASQAAGTAATVPAERPAKPAKRAERPAKAKVPADQRPVKAKMRAEPRAKRPAPPERPITRERAPRARTIYSVDVEEALLSRIAAYVKETPPPHLAAEPAEGLEGRPSSQS